MASIDERIVEMKFDNKDFEKNVGTTMNSLDELKKNLDMERASKEFDKIEKASKNVSFDVLAKNVENIAKRFSTFGIIGMTVLQNLTTSAMQAGKAIYNATIGQITEGGKRRALNIEQAKFQIEGLGYAWEDVIDDINYGVKDTAYGLDSAAKAASQLLASQVQTGDQMKAALRAISGVAAMTSSEYDDIASIFTTVAGNGKLMSEQLMQMSSRGLNAAATLGNALGKTEAEIREMVSKGKIDFNTFATAMDSAFGEHAKKANEIFNGALSNMKAALSRIGANFATPAYQKLRDVINSLTPVIDDVNKALTPLIDLWTQGLTVVAKFTSELLSNINMQEHLADPIKDVRTTILYLVESFQKLFEVFRAFFSPIFSGFENSFTSFFDLLRNASSEFLTFSKSLYSMKDSFAEVGSEIRSRIDFIASIIKSVFGTTIPIGLDSFIKSFSGLSSTFENIGQILNLVRLRFQLFTSQLSDSESIAPSLKNIFDGLFSVIRLGVAIIDAITSAFLELAKVVSQKLGYNLGNKAASVFEIIGEAGLSFSGFVDIIIERIETLSDSFNALIREGTLLSSVITVLGAIFQKVGELGNRIKNFFSEIEFSFDGVHEVFTKLHDVFSKVFEKITQAFENFVQNINFDDIISMINVAFVGLASFQIANLAKAIIDFFKGLKDGTSVFGDIAEKVGTTLDVVKDSLESWQENLQVNKLIGIAIAIGIIAASLLVLAQLELDQLIHGLGGLAAIFAGLYTALEYYNQFDMSGLNTLPLIALASAILILAVAVEKMGNLELNTLAKGLLGVGVALVEFAAFLRLAGNFTHIKPGDSVGLIALAAALIVLGSAVEKFGSMDPEEMTRGLLACGLAILELVAFTDRVGGQKKMLSVGVGMIALAAAMVIFSKAVGMFGSMNPDVLIVGLSAMGLALLGISAAMMLMPSEANMVSIGAGMVLIATAMVILSKALSSFGSMSVEQIAKSLVVLGVSLAAIATAMIFMQKSISGAASLLIISTALAALAPVLLLFGSMSIEQIVKSLVMLAGVFGVLGAAAILLGPMVPTLAALAGVLALMGVAALAAGAGAMMFSAALVALSTSGVGLVAAIEQIIMTVVNLIPEIFKGIGQGLIELFNALADGGEAIFNFAATVIQAFFNAITASLPSIFSTISTFLNGILDIVEEMLPRLLTIVSMVIEGLLSLIDTYVPQIINVGFNLITSFLTAIRDNIGQITVIAGEIIVNFLNGISQELPNIINAAMELAISFVKGLTQAIDENGSELVEAVLELLVTIIEALLEGIAGFVTDMWDKGVELFGGFIDGIGSMFTDVKNAASNVVQGALNAVKGFADRFTGAGTDCANGFRIGLRNSATSVANEAWNVAHNALLSAKAAVDSDSPSKKFIKLGQDCDEGMRIGINKLAGKVSDASSKMASGALDGARTMLGDFQNLFDTDSDFNPVITPVLDLSKVKSDARSMSDLFPTDAINASLNVSSKNVDGAMGSGIFRDYSNRDVVSAINKLSTNLDKLQNGSTTIINGVTYDDGSGISTAVGQLVEAVIVDGRM